MVNALFTDLGSAVATGLHTAGAIAYLAGLVGFVSWSRHLHQGTHHARTLLLGQVLAYVGVLANLLGGFIRTYQPGHPSFFDFGASGWATVMVLKHAALFLGIGFAVYLFEMVAPRLLRTFKEHGSQALPQKAGRGSVWVVAVSIFLAAALGAWTTVLPVGAAAAGGGVDGAGVDGSGEGLTAFEGGTYTYSGAAQSGGAPTEGNFDVGDGATVLDVVFLGVVEAPMFGDLPTSPAVFTLTLTAPDGTEYVEQTDAQGTGDLAGAPVPERRIDLTIPDPVPGDWTFRVSGDAAAGSKWDLSLSIAGPEGFVLADTVTKGPDDGFCEINTLMELGATLSWNWTTEPESPIHFDVHTHFDGEVQYIVDDDAATGGAGNVTADREGGYSLLWENNGASALDIVYRVVGDFRIHSIVGC